MACACKCEHLVVFCNQANFFFFFYCQEVFVSGIDLKTENKVLKISGIPDSDSIVGRRII